MAAFNIYVAALNTPWALITLPFVITAMVILLKYYIKSFREINRLSSVTRSPLMNHLGETIAGTTTIRSFHRENMFVQTNYSHLNVVTNVSFWRESLRSWFAIRIEFVSLFILAVTTGFLVSDQIVLIRYSCTTEKKLILSWSECSSTTSSCSTSFSCGDASYCLT